VRNDGRARLMRKRRVCYSFKDIGFATGFINFHSVPLSCRIYGASAREPQYRAAQF
jgi:hypothetical protein